MPIRVLIVDDSAFVRRALQRVLSCDAGFEVAAVAENGRAALEVLAKQTVDAVVLDVEMPVMDGLETLKALRERQRSLPVVMFSTLTTRGGEATLEALTLGANDYVTKPSQQGNADQAFAAVERELLPRLRTLVEHHWARVGRPAHASAPATVPAPCKETPVASVRATATRSTASAAPLRPTPVIAPDSVPRPTGRRRESPIDVIAIGVSTGGPSALHQIFAALPADLGVPIVLVQHMPPLFTGLLAQRLDAISAWEVLEAKQDDELRPGRALLAPGDFHLGVKRERGVVRAQLSQSAPVNSCRPAVDVLFRSVAQVYGGRVLAVVLTGMGRDGLEGSRELVQGGAHCIVQDAESSVVWGMPGYVAKEGLADAVVPLTKIVEQISKCVRAGSGAHRTTMV